MTKRLGPINPKFLRGTVPLKDCPQQKFEPVAGPASTGEEKFKVCCADAEITVTDEKVQVSCPHGSASFYLAARPSEPSGSVPQAPSSPEDVPDLYRLAYMPGVWRCPKCEFVLSKATISMSSASIVTTPEDRQSEECPNDGEWMVPVTYKESLKQCQDRLLAELERPKTPTAEMVDHLIWALDIMKMYEGRLIQFGDPPVLVYSDVHKKRLAEARHSIEDAAKYVEFRVPNIETRNPKE